MFQQKHPYPELASIMKRICQHAGYSLPSIMIHPHTQSGVDSKGVIHMAFYKPNGETFDKDTLLLVAIHEVSHLVSCDPLHGELFLHVERNLRTSAELLHFITPTSIISDSYPSIS